MKQMADANPWLAMWSQPRKIIRVLVHNKPAYGVLCLATLFALQSFFYYANWWSLGLKTSSCLILFGALILSPLAGFFWLYFVGWVYSFTGRWLKGYAPISHLRAALAWSKIPELLNLLMWFVLLLSYNDLAFIQDGGGSSSLLINLITLTTFFWSFILLFQSLKELQRFSTLKSLLNILLGFTFSRTILFFAAILFRFIYLSI